MAEMVELYCNINGEFYPIGATVPSSSALPVVDGAVCTYVSDEIAEPYLKEWGWHCCNATEKELYRWLYRHMLKGAVDAVDAIVADEITQDIIARRRAEGVQIVNDVVADDYATFMVIPVAEFGITDESILYTICQRVMMDNPLLMFPFYPSLTDSIAVIKGNNGICRYIYSIVPTLDKRAQAREICAEQIGQIVQKVVELYGIRPGYNLTMEHKSWVLKVIHDYLILHGNMDGDSVAWWLFTPYAVYDHRYKGNCTSYTMAFCAAARLYGIEAINMTGIGYVNKDNSADGSYELNGNHAWVAVRLSDEEYGAYPSDPAKWSCIDVYWDEPLHEVKIGNEPDRKDIIWKYFLNMPEINILSEDDEKSGHSYRIVDANIAYGALPIDAAPTLSMPYSGNNEYIWEGEK